MDTSVIVFIANVNLKRKNVQNGITLNEQMEEFNLIISIV